MSMIFFVTMDPYQKLEVKFLRKYDIATLTHTLFSKASLYRPAKCCFEVKNEKVLENKPGD